MPPTCTCKGCGHEVPPAEVCSVCGSKLNPAQAHLTWKIVRTPVLDWMCWNAVMRIVLPVLFSVLLLALWMEVLSGGLRGVEALVTGGLPTAIAAILAAVTLVVLIIMLLRGKELLLCTIDSKGMHIERYLPHPTALQLLARFKPTAVLAEHPDGPLLIDCLDTAWKDIARVQLWPEKSYLILYSPSWWQCMALPAAPLVWNDSLDMIRQKIGKKKGVRLPAALRDSKPPKPKAARAAAPQPERATRHARPFEGMDQPPPYQPPQQR